MHISYLRRISTDIFRQGADRLAEQVEDLKSKVGEIENPGETVGKKQPESLRSKDVKKM